MQTRIELEGVPSHQITVAEQALRRCVHCGFCNATCPTYQVTGNELDGPRGRIYLIKGALEGGEVTATTQHHLDRCLTCTACETTCPSGVPYHDLLSVGRELVDARVRRSWREGLGRVLLRALVSRRWPVAALLPVGRLLRPALPGALREMMPAPLPALTSGTATAPGGTAARNHGDTATAQRAAAADGNARAAAIQDTAPPGHDDGMPAAARAGTGAAPDAGPLALFEGCVQPVLAPATNAAAERVLRRVTGADVVRLRRVRCCGALHHHFGDAAAARRLVRRNVTAMAAMLDAGTQAIVTTASGCAAFMRDYAKVLADGETGEVPADARRVAAAVRDVAEVLPARQLARLTQEAPTTPPDAGAMQLHCPCTLEHGLKGREQVLACLEAAGVAFRPDPSPGACCGSAGAYSMLQPAMARELGERRARSLVQSAPRAIITANVGCQHHLATHARAPVYHWIEAVDERLAAAERAGKPAARRRPAPARMARGRAGAAADPRAPANTEQDP